MQEVLERKLLEYINIAFPIIEVPESLREYRLETHSMAPRARIRPCLCHPTWYFIIDAYGSYNAFSLLLISVGACRTAHN